MRILMMALLLVLLPATVASAQSAAPASQSSTTSGPQFPANPNKQWVIDEADILPPSEEAALNTKLKDFETKNGHQLVVLTVNSLGGYDVADYGYQAGRHYAIGDVEKDDGVLLVIAPNERKLHIAVGYGLEPILTDAYSSLIINQAITPQFKAGNFPAGINAGVDQIANQISLPPEEARARAEKVQTASRDRSGSDSGMAIFWIIVFLFFILPIIIRMMRGNRGRRYGSGPVVIWGPGFGSGYGGGGFGGGSGGGGGFGGGGFSGGGGGFGGGGASGSW